MTLELYAAWMAASLALLTFAAAAPHVEGGDLVVRERKCKHRPKCIRRRHRR